MLNDYQRQFLRHLIQTNCRFLLIGGMARCLQTGMPTRDLDLLVDISPANPRPLEFALRFWKSRHPLHSMLNFEGPLALRPDVHISFPDGDGCGYVTTLNQAAFIDYADRVDVLTPREDQNFEDLYARSIPWDFEGQTLRMLCREDL